MKGKMRVRPVCSNCKTRVTPLWRKGPNNTYNCNACGLYYRMYKKNRPSRYRPAAYGSRKHAKRESSGHSECTAPAHCALDCDACSFGHASSCLFQDSHVGDDAAAVDQNQAVTENKAEPGKIFDVSDNESRSRAEKQEDGALKHDAREAKPKDRSEGVHMDRMFDGEEKVFAYKTGVSFHVGKYLHTSSHSAGVSQRNYSPEFAQSPNCFRASQRRHQSYMDVCGGIEFPKIRMVPVDTFLYKHRRRRRSFLNEEEMEAAEALADFAYRVRHGECD